MRPIQTVGQLRELQNDTFVYAAIVAVVIFAISWLIANAIPYQGGNDKSYIKRRIWSIALVILGAVAFWLYNDLYVTSHINKVAFQNQFATTNLQCLGITIGGSIALSFIVMMCFRHTKYGSILGREKNS